MPLDYRIPASVKVPEWTPTSTLQQESLNDLQIKTAAKKQIEDAADQSALVAALKAHVGADGVPDFDGAINSLYTTRPKAAQMLAEQVTKLREQATKQHAAELDQHTKEAQLMSQLFDDKTDATSYPIARSLAVRLDPEADKILPPTWDDATTPTIVSKIRQAGTTVAEQNRLEKDAQQQLSSGDSERGAAATMANATSAEDWDNRLHQIALFAPKAVYEHWKATPFSPEAVAQARQMAITPEKQAELDAQKATQDRIAEREAAQLKISQGNLDVARGNLAARQKEASQQAATTAQTVDEIATDARTTLSGKKYIDLGDFDTPTAKAAARAAAKKAGLTVLDKTEGDSLQAADTAKLNIQAMWGQIKSKLPTDSTGRILAGPENKLSKFFQTDADLAAFNSWRAGAIQAVQALVERGMGFRLNQAEINMIMSNDMPQITDTVQTAERRVKNVLKLLQDKEDVMLTRDRSTLGSGGGTFRMVVDGKAYEFLSQQAMDDAKKAALAAGKKVGG